MSELQHYLRPEPAYEPVRTEGNVLWRDGHRFLIKGINYFIRQPKAPDQPLYPMHKVDCLSDEYLGTLRRDIQVFRELGLNTIYVSSLDPANGHHEAFKLLADAGLYVVVTIGEDITGPERPQTDREDFNPDFDTSTFHTRDAIERSLLFVDELADYPNVLGFVVDGDALVKQTTTKIAEVMRAHVRDIKSHLRLRGGRQVPVGVSLCHAMTIQLLSVQYFSAGPSSDEGRADFIAMENYSWAKHSSFQVSGWKNQVKMLQQYPVPMFLGEYGTVVDYRLWQEVGCLYSRDMTGVFSGGCAYTYYEYGNKYGIVKEDGQGWLHRKPDFELLRKEFQTVNCRMPEELFDAHVKDYESWTGEYPERDEHRWFATSTLPDCPLDLANLLLESGEEKDWEGVGDKAENLTL